MSGRVALVGAGPGDPALLTRRAVSLLRHADLVLYDALVPAAMLKIARRARRFYVGKRAGRHSITQDAINRLMIRAARRGDHVVRLKCGDPFVFGRGGEEAIALRAANIAVEIVPGVTSAFAAPALAGIPVTHRGCVTGVVVVSGHAPEAYEPLLASVEPGTATIVVLMGLATRAALANRLLARGWRPETPAAIVLGAAQPDSHTWSGRLDGLGAAEVTDTSAAGTIVIGSVVALAPLIAGAEGPALHVGRNSGSADRQSGRSSRG
jgi:uroporphyrin-III C-methyltransferase / precorrin-2 dehydrogenase / sirohydrochlorin ferrochelatase